MFTKRIVFFIILFVSIFPFFGERALLTNYKQNILDFRHGLAQGTVSAIEQTPDGFIWFGNQESLSRYDGLQIINYTKKNTPILKSSWIQCLKVSADGSLLIGTWRGGVYKKSGEKFEPLGSKNLRLEKSIVYALESSKNEDIWAATSDGLFQITQNNVLRFGQGEGLPSNNIRSLQFSDDGFLWIGTEENGLVKFKDGKFVHITKLNGLKKNQVWSLKKGLNKDMWIGSGNVLTNYQNGKFKYYLIPNSSALNYISDIELFNNGDIYLSLLNEGLWHFSKGKFNGYSEKDGLLSNLTISVLRDREENIWVGTEGLGVGQFTKRSVKVISEQEGLGAEQVWTVLETKNGDLWAGTHGGGLSRIVDGKVTNYSQKDGLSSAIITALHESVEGGLWVGTSNNGFNFLKDGKIQQHRLGESLQTNIIYAIFEKKDKSLMIGTEAGLVFWKNGEIIRTINTDNGLSNNSVREIIRISKDKYWLATDIGLNLLQGNSIKSWTKQDGMIEDSLNGLYYDHEGNLWIGTYGGGILYFDGQEFTTITEEDGLHNNVVYKILEDKNHRFWMSSNKGIFCVEEQHLLDFVEKKINKIQCVAFGIEEGMKSLECNGGRQPAGCITKDQYLCFPTTNGLAMMNLATVSFKESIPTAIITEVKINDSIILTREGIEVPPGRGNTEFTYTVPYFNAPEKIKFKFFLENYDEEWRETSDIRKAYYTHIPPGDYTFCVKASNKYGEWGGLFTKLSLYIRPQFHQTVYFYILLSIIGLLGIIGVFRWRNRQLMKRKKALEKLVKERTAKIALQNQELEKLSIVARETDNGVIITNSSGKVIWVNEGFSRMFGYSFEELFEKFGRSIFNLSMKPDINKNFKKCIKTKKTIRFESSTKTKSGDKISILTTLTPILSKTNQVKKIIAIDSDISKLNQAYEKMKEMSVTDSLTGLKNRRYFFNIINREIQMLFRTFSKKPAVGLVYPFTFLMVDIDHFKEVNDVYGHSAGDQLLIEVCQRMLKTLRSSDLLVRWGGEEFLIMIKDDGLEGTNLLTKRLLQEISGREFVIDGVDIKKTISIGCCGLPFLDSRMELFTWEEIVHLADSALYIAKNSGRNRVVNVEMYPDKLKRDDLVKIKTHFHRALKNKIIKVKTIKGNN